VDDDPDKDGVKGADDKCPDQAGPGTADGCPPPPKVQVVGNDIKITEKIMFEDGKADIKPESNKLVEEIANVMKAHPEIEYVEIAGHADVHGKDDFNKTLTKNRAGAVVAALEKLGVDKNKMRGVGYSSYCTVDNSSPSEEVQAKNRRVEFKILKMSGKETDVKWGGCDAATKKGMKPQPLPTVKGPTLPKVTETKAAPPPKAAEPKKK